MVAVLRRRAVVPLESVPSRYIVHVSNIVRGVPLEELERALVGCGCYATGTIFGPSQDVVVIRVPDESPAYALLRPDKAKGLCVILVDATEAILLKIMADNGYNFRQKPKPRRRAR